MYSLLLVIIYLAFISLGLPDSLVGAGWPVMHQELQVPVSYAGILTMTIAFGTIISSLFSARLTRKMGTGLVTAISVLLTATALFGFSFSHSFIILCLWAVPYGLGAGAVDATLNNYVALNYASRHMNWLHCFWGVGAAISPYLMSFALNHQLGWNNGYRAIGILQVGLTVVLFLSLPLWKKKATQQVKTTVSRQLSLIEILHLKGMKAVMVAFLAYCALEQTTGLWASTFLVQARHVDVVTAAKFASFYYLGITFGRFLSGFISDWLGDKKMIRLGCLILMVGIILIGLPLKNNLPSLIGLIIAGVGSVPIYPAVIHATPNNFGAENSRSVIGVQMASAYVGTTFMPPLIGWLSGMFGIQFYPMYLLLFAIVMLVTLEILNKQVTAEKAIVASGK